MEIDRLIFNFIGYLLLTVLSLLCLIPFFLVLSGSLTPEREIQLNGFSLVPPTISLDAYRYILNDSQALLRSYGITILLTAAGVVSGLIISAMAAYVIQVREARFGNKLAFFIYFTSLFSGGLVPLYILMVNVYQLKDTFWAMLLPPLLSVWNIIIMKNYMQTIPKEIGESARIDGAGHFRIFYSITLPLSVPILSTIGLFIGLNYWNEWYNAMLYINNRNLYPLQYFLYRMLNSGKFAEAVSRGARISIQDLPRESMKMAVIILSTIPIFIVYPFVQSKFVKGLTMGSIKG
jgi:putative aldouronate transport system permease protein